MNSQGWECPKCNRVYAPHITECWNCNSQQSYPINPYPQPCHPWPGYYPYIIWDSGTTISSRSGNFTYDGSFE